AAAEAGEKRAADRRLPVDRHVRALPEQQRSRQRETKQLSGIAGRLHQRRGYDRLAGRVAPVLEGEAAFPALPSLTPAAELLPRRGGGRVPSHTSVGGCLRLWHQSFLQF